MRSELQDFCSNTRVCNQEREREKMHFKELEGKVPAFISHLNPDHPSSLEDLSQILLCWL